MATQHTRFTWDEEKAAVNVARHSIDFTTARAALAADDRAVEEVDDRQDYGEVRTNSIVRLGPGTMCVCWTMREGVTRIISARPASRKERKRYGEQG